MTKSAKHRNGVWRPEVNDARHGRKSWGAVGALLKIVAGQLIGWALRHWLG
jgi:hypothetical protein